MEVASQFRYCPYDGTSLIEELSKAGIPNNRCPRCEFVDHRNPLPCVAFFIVYAGRILLSLRGDEPAKGKWDIPGGFVDYGQVVEGNVRRETVEDAVRREADEETGLQVEIVAYLGSLPDVYVYKDRQFPTLNMVYLVRAVSGDLKAQSDAAELRWFPIDQIPVDMAFAHQREAVELLRRHLERSVR